MSQKAISISDFQDDSEKSANIRNNQLAEFIVQSTKLELTSGLSTLLEVMSGKVHYKNSETNEIKSRIDQNGLSKGVQKSFARFYRADK